MDLLEDANKPVDNTPFDDLIRKSVALSKMRKWTCCTCGNVIISMETNSRNSRRSLPSKNIHEIASEESGIFNMEEQDDEGPDGAKLEADGLDAQDLF